MQRAQTILPAGSWNAAQAADAITLAFDDRFRRRMALKADNGLAFLLDLPEARHLREGDGLQLDDGQIVAVRAAEEDLVEISAGLVAKKCGFHSTRSASFPTSTEPTSCATPWVIAGLIVYLAT